MSTTEHKALKILTTFTVVETAHLEDKIAFDEQLTDEQVYDALEVHGIFKSKIITIYHCDWERLNEMVKLDPFTMFRRGQLAHSWDPYFKDKERRAMAYFYTFEYVHEEDGQREVTHGIEVQDKDSHKFYIENSSYFELYGDKVKITKTRIDHIGVPGVIQAFMMDEVEPVATIYNRVQCYGGPEEGGWYYHIQEAVDTVELDKIEEVENGGVLDCYGEGVLVEKGFYFGQHENTTRPIYC